MCFNFIPVFSHGTELIILQYTARLPRNFYTYSQLGHHGTPLNKNTLFIQLRAVVQFVSLSTCTHIEGNPNIFPTLSEPTYCAAR